ncbi:restriction endonuclease subunit S [Pseudothauera lacus]|uniref:Restriction endonuclease subunit S n=1 Tax=Pseudothauera lacus TaxID=2136175 RepID=A0A2T4IDH8_9RHOO|nr:restriction endonuclease subunit S [Pseudothauera lacus]PTD95831.1 restriction endonuclease subunit S [Pseudothauera lacus]
MSSEWQTYSVDELVTQKVLGPPLDGNHGAIHPKASDFVPAGIPFIMASDMKDGLVDTINCAFITKQQAAALRKGFAKTGDVLLSHKATIGRTALVGKIETEYLVLTPQVTYYRVLDAKRLNSRYLKYYFDSAPFQQTLGAWAGAGSTRAYIGITAQRKLPVVLPPIDLQNEIASILGALDDRITLLRETNATLKAIAQALFKSWFVDFDPVRAKQQGLAPEGMDEATAALFPDGFEESELGPVPRGWRVGTLGDVLALRNERTKPSDETRALPYVPIESISAKMPFLQEYKSGEEANSSLILFRRGDILFGAMRPYFHKVCIAPFDGVTRTTVFTLKSNNLNASGFALFLAFQEATIEYATQHSEGSTIPYAKWGKSLEYMPIILPPESVQIAFSEVVTSFVERANENIEHAQTLATLRDTLLPRLISGQLRLGEDQAQPADFAS